MKSNKMVDLYPIILEAFSNNMTFKFPVNGTSMQPLLKTLDSVEIEKFNELKVGDIVLFRRLNGSFVLHRIIKMHDDLYDIVGDHQTKIEKDIKKEQIIAKVISYSKKGKEKEYNLRNFKYRIYKFFVKFKIVRFIYAHLL